MARKSLRRSNRLTAHDSEWFSYDAEWAKTGFPSWNVTDGNHSDERNEETDGKLPVATHQGDAREMEQHAEPNKADYPLSFPWSQAPDSQELTDRNEAVESNAIASDGKNRGLKLEHETLRALDDLGWDCEPTPKTGDYGADVIATTETELLVIQCKDWNGSTGISAVQEVHYALAHYQKKFRDRSFEKCRAIAVSRTGFSKSARSAARNVGVLFFSIDQLVPGCALDRTERGIRIRRERREEQQRKAKEIEKQREEARQREQERQLAAVRYNSERWAEYDEQLAEYEKQRRQSNGLWPYLLGWIVGALFIGIAASAKDAVFIRFGMFGVAAGLCHYFLSRPTPPAKPVFPRPE